MRATISRSWQERPGGEGWVDANQGAPWHAQRAAPTASMLSSVTLGKAAECSLAQRARRNPRSPHGRDSLLSQHQIDGPWTVYVRCRGCLQRPVRRSDAGLREHY
ncbi:hypothetical protein PMIN04_001030 [Paraphaeosphaeria minitans]